MVHVIGAKGIADRGANIERLAAQGAGSREVRARPRGRVKGQRIHVDDRGGGQRNDGRTGGAVVVNHKTAGGGVRHGEGDCLAAGNGDIAGKRAGPDEIIAAAAAGQESGGTEIDEVCKTRPITQHRAHRRARRERAHVGRNVVGDCHQSAGGQQECVREGGRLDEADAVVERRFRSDAEKAGGQTLVVVFGRNPVGAARDLRHANLVHTAIEVSIIAEPLASGYVVRANPPIAGSIGLPHGAVGGCLKNAIHIQIQFAGGVVPNTDQGMPSSIINCAR